MARNSSAVTTFATQNWRRSANFCSMNPRKGQAAQTTWNTTTYARKAGNAVRERWSPGLPSALTTGVMNGIVHPRQRRRAASTWSLRALKRYRPLAHFERCVRDCATVESGLFVEHWILLQVVSQGPRRDAHRTRRLPFHVRHRQSPTNRLAFDPLDVLTQVQRRNGGRSQSGAPQDNGLTGNPAARAEDDGSLDRIL